MTNNLTQAKIVASSLAHQAGAIIKSKLSLGTSRIWKSDQTPVTEVDKEINDLVIETINREFPEHSILSEEGSDLGRSKEFIWVCDPIDGTFPFMHGIPISTFTLALVQSGQPILGLIYDPFMDRLFVAEKGKGTTLNNQIIHTSDQTALKNSSMGIVSWKGTTEAIAKARAQITDQNVTLYSLVSIAYMDAMVACGQFVATIFPGTSAHDSAAAKIIVEEAGGVFTSLTGEIDRYDQPVHGHLASANQGVHDQLVELLR